jgi:hypothetical protein
MNQKGQNVCGVLFLITFVVIVYLYLQGMITFTDWTFNFGVISGKIQPKNEIILINFSTTAPPAELQPPKIEAITLDKQVYHTGEIVNVSFYVINELDIPYNITSNWILNKSILRGTWSNESLARYNSSWKKEWQVWQSVNNDAGDWELQIIVQYALDNRTILQDNITSFRVISSQLS